MSLQTEFESRYTLKHRVEISNPDDRAATTQNDTLVAIAAIDAAAEFETEVQVALDLTVANHVRVAVMFVEYMLLQYGAVGASVVEKKRTILDARVEALRKTTSRKRVTPSTTSLYKHSTFDSVQRPEFDDEQFWDTIPDAPNRDGTNDP